MKNNKLTIGAAALTAVIVTAGFAASSFAYQGDPAIEGPNHTPERHEAMTAAFESGNYEAWKSVKSEVAKGRIMEKINEDNFSKFVEMRNARLAGDTATADSLRAELGLGQGKMIRGEGGQKGGGKGNRGGQGMRGTETRGQNTGGNFVDADGNGACDNL